MLGIVQEAQTAAAVLDRKFPNSHWRSDALDLLKAQGLEPAENKTSWISRISHAFSRPAPGSGHPASPFYRKRVGRTPAVPAATRPADTPAACSPTRP
jgi:hypothetical protein